MKVLDRLVSGAAGVWGAMPMSLRRRFLHATNPSFLVGVVGIVHDGEGRVLLLEHRFRPPHPWGLPGGFIDHGETFEGALARELDEEVGLAVEIEPGIFDVELNVKGSYVAVTLVASAVQKELPAIRSREIVRGAFFAGGDLPEGTYPHHAALVRAYQASLHAKSPPT